MKNSTPFLMLLQACLIAGLLQVGLIAGGGVEPLVDTDIEESCVETTETVGLSGGVSNQFSWDSPTLEDVHRPDNPASGISRFWADLRPSSCLFSCLVPLRL